MNKIIKYLNAYGAWLVNLGLAAWLFFLTRTVYLDIFSFFYKPGGWAYAHRVEFIDKILVLILGLGWLVFMIMTESYYRSGALEVDLFKRFARVTGPLLIVIFGMDLILIWLEGASNGFHWLILAAELGIGIAFILLTRSQPKSKRT